MKKQVMKTKMLLVVLAVFFAMVSLEVSLEAGVAWNTFYGGEYSEQTGMARDVAGNIYICGYDYESWGTPLVPLSGSRDAFVVKLDASGHRLWHTYLGNGGGMKEASAVTCDALGNVYVVGNAAADWGTPPLRAYSDYEDGFVAKLDGNGTLQWYTFLGGMSSDKISGVGVDGSGKIYVSGYSYQTWDTPLSAHSGEGDVFLACLDNAGGLLWHTFLGANSHTLADFDLAVDASGNCVVSGVAFDNFGSPINPHRMSSGYDMDVFVARFNSQGTMLWNTFVNSEINGDRVRLAVDGVGNVYVGAADWSEIGSPVRSFSGFYDVKVTALDTLGNYLWHTYLGGDDMDEFRGIGVDAQNNVYVSGTSFTSWGTPADPKSAPDYYSDVFLARLDAAGQLTYNTFFGVGSEAVPGLVVVDADNILVNGRSYASWGTPTDPFVGPYRSGFTAKISPSIVTERYTISGRVTLDGVGMEGVEVVSAGYLNYTDADGYYSFQVDAGWSGTITAYKFGYSFSGSNTYDNVDHNYSDQDFLGAVVYQTISGTVTGVVSGSTQMQPLAGVSVAFSNDGHVVVTDADGFYSHQVPQGARVRITPSKAGVDAWTPPYKDIYQVSSDNVVDFVQDTVALQVEITSPSANATVSGYVTFKVDVQFLSGKVTSCTYYMDGRYMGSKSPYTNYYDYRNWRSTNYPNGNHKFEVRVYHSSGKSITRYLYFRVNN